MSLGLSLRLLTLTGAKKEPARVRFTHGLNVIAGPSDTGKSYIVQCIDYALGSGTRPKTIPEAEGYSSISLEIEANHDQRVYTLERSLRGGKIVCKTSGQPDRLLAAKHQAGKEDTVSQFLLNLSGLGTKRVRTNEQGKTRPLSFRDLIQFVLVDEETVIKETSPILSGQHISKTAEIGVFRILLTGTDDSSIIAKEDAKVTKGKQAGKVELLEALLKDTRLQLATLGEFGVLVDERDRLVRIEVSIQAALVERDAAQANITPLQARQSTAWIALRLVESKFAVLSELQTRFDLLQQQYSSDLRRLETIAEAGIRLGHLKEERCPMCGALAEHHDRSHREGRSTPANVSHACKVEAEKTLALLQDLKITREATATEIQQLGEDRTKRRQDLDAIGAELMAMMHQHLDVATKRVDDFRARAENCRSAIEILERQQELSELLEDAKKPKKRPRAEAVGAAVTTAQADAFSKEVELLLASWHFPNLDRVSFSENDQDIVISGRARNTHGKGVRAITRAAFNLALLRLCLEDERPFPNFVLIDSPLLVYEEPDPGETSFPQDVKKHFWENVKASFGEAQVILIENSKQLTGDVAIDGVNVVLFTGNEQGRRGFIP